MIESSDLALHKDSMLKRINFSNFNDIKINVMLTTNIDLTEHKKICEDNKKFFDSCFISGDKTISYKDVVITKLDPDQDNMNSDCSKAVNVYDHLNTLKDEPNSDCNDGIMHDTQDCVNYSDDDYAPHRQYLIKRKKKKRNPAKGTEVKKILIKPIMLEDLKLIPTKPQPKCVKIKKKYVYKKSSMCNYCGKMTSNIKQHLLQHTGTRKYKCEICSNAFYTEKSLKHHIKTTHIKDKNFKCDQCLTKFKTTSALKRHMMVHTDERNHVCPICNKAFKRKMAMLRHVPIHSAASKTIKCDLCNMSFICRYGLKHHMRVHTGERPYRCEMCSQGYSYKHDFNRHCLKKHGVFFKRRSVYIMNEEVLQKERDLMRKLMLSVKGIVKDDEPFKAFDVPQGQKALAQAIKLIESKQIPVDLNC